MRDVGLGIVVGIGLTLLATEAVSHRGSVYAQHPAAQHRTLAEGALIALDAATGDGGRQITLIDPRQRVMSVYRVDLATGTISLRGVRNVRWDFLMDEFHGGTPSPQEIRALVENNRR